MEIDYQIYSSGPVDNFTQNMCDPVKSVYLRMLEFCLGMIYLFHLFVDAKE